MSEVYIRDVLITETPPGDDDLNRRSQDEIDNILTGLVPRPTKSMRQVRLGFTASYPNDKDANYIFKPEIITKLKDQNLTACLSHNTKEQREIYILNPPQSTYYKRDEHICTELELRNNISILFLEKFISSRSNK